MSEPQEPGPTVVTVTVPPSDAPRDGLPTALTSFVGRERELAELRGALGQTRLLTLTGAGGCGKTRLALQLAAELEGEVWWVDLAPVVDGRLIGAAIGEALGVRPLPGRTELQACAAYLASRRALVVLDNCEHLLEACAAAAALLLRAGREVVVVATSRAPLSVEGETAWRVPSLSLPRAGSLEGSDAASLFAERARQARPGLVLGEGDALAVARICESCDGLPLAIELAAARLRMFSVEQIAVGVADRFRLLTGGPRTAVARQQTLRASVNWSYALLSGEEQVLLRRLAVFVGGFTLEAVESVCAGDGIERERVLDLLASLVDQSLVIAEERYRLLETLRQFAVERLIEAGEERVLRERHRDRFVAFAEQAGAHLETAAQREWMTRLDPDAANLAAALEHALVSDPAVALRLCVALYPWWRARGRLAEAELANSRSLAFARERWPVLRARVLARRAFLVVQMGDDEAAGAHASEAFALAYDAGDLGTAARARCFSGQALLIYDPRAARAELTSAAQLARTAGDDWVLVTATQLTAASYVFQFDHARAARANDEVAALAEPPADPFLAGRRWLWNAWMAVHDGRLAEGRDALERARAAWEGIGGPGQDGEIDYGLAMIETWQGQPARAVERLAARLERVIKHGAGIIVPSLLEALALAELAAGRPGPARDRLERLLELLGDREGWLTARALGLLAEARRLLGDAAAEPTARRAQAASERFGCRFLGTHADLTLARLAAARGEWGVAQQHALAHLDVCARGGHRTYVPACLDGLAEIAAGLGSYADAARLLAAADHARAQLGTVRVPPETEQWGAIERDLRAALGEVAYAAAHAQGAELSIDDALEWARRGRGPRRRPLSGWPSLTPTEARVAELIVQGLTNPQIAERMFISPQTVKTHVSHIFGKLDVHTRAELIVLRRDATS